MTKQALLIVSFGTSEKAAEKSISLTESTLSAQMPNVKSVRAFTSPTIRKILARRGENIPSAEQALERLSEEGFTHAIIQPTNIIGGIEYNKLKKTAEEFLTRFEELKLGRPLLNDMNDVKRLAEILSEEYPRASGRAIVLMGHGTEHEANEIYRMMQSEFSVMGREDIFVAAAEGKPDIYDIRQRLTEKGIKKACLVPMMLTAGRHARDDMAGEQETSWKNVLKNSGIQAECILNGLGECEKVRQMYVDRLSELDGALVKS